MSDKTHKTRLSAPLKNGDKEIHEVEVTKPSVGALRGLKMTDVLQMDVTALMTLLPRVTRPALTPDQVAALDPADFTDLSGKLLLFFARAEQLEGLAAQGSA